MTYFEYNIEGIRVAGWHIAETMVADIRAATALLQFEDPADVLVIGDFVKGLSRNENAKLTLHGWESIDPPQRYVVEIPPHAWVGLLDG